MAWGALILVAGIIGTLWPARSVESQELGSNPGSLQA